MTRLRLGLGLNLAIFASSTNVKSGPQFARVWCEPVLFITVSILILQAYKDRLEDVKKMEDFCVQCKDHLTIKSEEFVIQARSSFLEHPKPMQNCCSRFRTWIIVDASTWHRCALSKVLYSGDLKFWMFKKRLVCKWSRFWMGSEIRTNCCHFVKNQLNVQVSNGPVFKWSGPFLYLQWPSEYQTSLVFEW